MIRTLGLLGALAAIATGCVPLDEDYAAFCEARPAICYGTGKGPPGSDDTIGGGVISGGTSNSDGFTIVDAFLGDNCAGPTRITNSVVSRCSSSGSPEFCFYYAYSDYYSGGQNPYPTCSERVKIRFTCYAETTRVHTAYDTTPQYPSSWALIDCRPYGQ